MTPLRAPVKSRLGWRFRCIYGVTVHCDQGERRPTRIKCGSCGSRLLVERGMWGVFPWTGTGRYPPENATYIASRPTSAEAFAKDAGPEFVVRFVPEVAS